MNDMTHHVPVIVLIVGILIFLSIGIKAAFQRWHMVPIAGYIALGWLFRLLDAEYSFLPTGMDEILRFMGQIGIITILFHVGLNSHIKNLIRQISRASVLAVGDIVVSGAFGFFGSYWLGLGLIPSLFISIALTATSIGVVMTIWEYSGQLDSTEGELLIDLSALDDIVGIALMAIVLEIAPLLLVGGDNHYFWPTVSACFFFFLKFLGFVILCTFFSYWVESRLMTFIRRYEHTPDPTITMICIAFIIAGVAALFGFSLVLGAFFAGLAFSRDRKTLKMESSLKPLEVFFAPFFFIYIGFQVFPEALSEGFHLAIFLIIFAALGKFIGIMIPAFCTRLSIKKALLIAVSMIPRAEITFVVMAHGLEMGPWAVTHQIYAAVVIVSFVTCLLIPLVLKPMMHSYTK